MCLKSSSLISSTEVLRTRFREYESRMILSFLVGGIDFLVVALIEIKKRGKEQGGKKVG